MKTLRLVAGLAGLAAVGWAAGFAWFLHVTSLPASPLRRADGIVVLTGGASRIGQGLHLLNNAAAPRLLISGVGPSTGVAAMMHDAGLDPATLAGRVTLGRSATSTHGNAEETVEWVRLFDLHSLIVVTAFYHMPRALAELRHALPGIALYPQPVLPEALQAEHARAPIGLLAKEYTKWLVLQTGLPHPASDRRPGLGLQ